MKTRHSIAWLAVGLVAFSIGCVLQTGSHDVARITGEGEADVNVTVDSAAVDTTAAR